jgi:hypothetical protein
VTGANGGADDALQEDLQAPFAEVGFHQLRKVGDRRFGSVADACGVCRVEREGARDARHLAFGRTELGDEFKRARWTRFADRIGPQVARYRRPRR